MTALTKKKKQILDFIQGFQQDKGYYPTLEEIRKKFQLNSLSTVHQHLSELEDLGMIERNYGKARDMKIATEQRVRLHDGFQCLVHDDTESEY